MTNHFAPQQKLVSKTRIGAKTTKKYDLPATPYSRVLADDGTVRKADKTRLAKENKPLNPAAIQRQIPSLGRRAASPDNRQTRPETGCFPAGIFT